MTAYQLTPVGPEGRQEDRSREIEVLSYSELLEQRDLLMADVEGWACMWHDEVNRRIGVQNRLNRSMRVLASLGRLSPQMAGLVASARREVYGSVRRDPAWGLRRRAAEGPRRPGRGAGGRAGLWHAARVSAASGERRGAVRGMSEGVDGVLPGAETDPAGADGVTWILAALCRTRPADWWDLGDDGNRLALAICSVCPSLRPCAAAAGVPVGVVRAGVAYGDDGPVPVCACGRPSPDALRAVCLRCDPPVVEPSRERPVRPSRETRIAALHASGVSLGNIAIEFGMPRSTVFAVVKRQRAA